MTRSELNIRFDESPIIARNADVSDGAKDATGNNCQSQKRRTMVTKTVFRISFQIDSLPKHHSMTTVVNYKELIPHDATDAIGYSSGNFGMTNCDFIINQTIILKHK